MPNLHINGRIDHDVTTRSIDRSRGGSRRTHEITMKKNLSYSTALLLALFSFTLLMPISVLAQSPITSSAFTIQNPAGETVTLGIPGGGVVPYSILFPSTGPVNGSLFTGSGTSGNTAWLAPGGVGTVLRIGSSGVPEWNTVNVLPSGSAPNTMLVWNNVTMQWEENTGVTATATGDFNADGEITGADLVITGDVTFANGVINNNELENDDVTITAGTGLSGGGTVALGGTITLNNDGILDVVGTVNQVNVAKAAGVATLSTPQDIHTGASPTFAGLDLTAVTGSSTSSDVLVLNGTSVESRTIHTLPGGTTTNATLIWNGSNWVENTNVTLTPGGDINNAGNTNTTGNTTVGGDLTVAGDVTFANGVINNNELENDDVTITAGTGLSGGGTVALGGTITLNNDGILDVVGTVNQVNVAKAAGVATLSTPQDIHTTASPTFDGMTLNNVTPGSSSSNVLVLNGANLIESRTIYTLPGGSTTNATLIWDGTNWVENTNVTLTPGGDINNAGNTNTTGNTTVGGDLTVAGDVTFANGVINNNELENDDVTITAGTGLSGGGTVALGGTITLNNDGILDVVGTVNQVNVAKAAGVATLSTPQDIHTAASPTFAGLDLTAVAGGSTSSDVLVLNGTSVESRTIYTLPGGSTTNATLIWDGSNWVENTNVTLTPGGDINNAGNTNTTGNTTVGGDLTVAGDVTFANGVINNNELEHSSINVSYGTGISGDASVSLGGTLNVQNTGVTSITGTPNQVIASASTGAVTLSAPQDIHTDAVPTFDGLTLDNLSSGSTATEFLVSNAGSVETRTLGSLIGTAGRVSTASATSGGGSWSMVVNDASVTATTPIMLTYEDPAAGAHKTVYVVGRVAGTSFTVRFSGKPATGSFINYYILP